MTSDGRSSWTMRSSWRSSAGDEQRAAVGVDGGREHARRPGLDGDQDASLRRRRNVERLSGLRGLRRGANRRGREELDHQALGGAEYVDSRAGGAPARQRDQRVDPGVGARRIVVVEREPAHAAGGGEVDRELDRAVAPAEVLRVLAEGELRVVDQEIRAGDERRVVNLVGALRRPLAARERWRMRLVVGGVDERRAVGLDPVAERQRRVVHVVGGDADVVDLDAAFDQVVVADLGGELLDRDRKIGVLHLARERLADRRPEAARSVDVPLEVPLEQRRQERQALDVVPVRMADEDMTPARPVRLREQRLAEAVRAGAAIEQDQRAARAAHLDARGVAAVAEGVGPGLRDRAAGAPETDAHPDLPVRIRQPNRSGHATVARFRRARSTQRNGAASARRGLARVADGQHLSVDRKRSLARPIQAMMCTPPSTYSVSPDMRRAYGVARKAQV